MKGGVYVIIFKRSRKKDEGREEKMRAMVLNMLKGNDSMDKICRVAECDEAYVKEIIAEMNAENE